MTYLLARLNRLLVNGLKLVVSVFILAHFYLVLIKWLPVPLTATMAQRSLQPGGIARDWISIDQVSEHLVTAVIAAEDTRFCKHSGIDFAAIRTVLAEHRGTGRLRGGSTITQQTAKNVFLWNGGGVLRKIPEAWLALLIDAYWGKSRVMEVYLNVAEWGDGLFGAEATAQRIFGKSASELTEYEASLMAAVLPSPNRWEMRPPGPYVQERAATLRARMAVVSRDQLADCLGTVR
ncbi:MAG: monofunctional biosynthetic peptidoglycan transglycosylase [Henriciella sp.]